MNSELIFDITKLKNSEIDISFKKSYNGAALLILTMGDNVIQLRCDPILLNKIVDAADGYWAGE